METLREEILQGQRVRSDLLKWKLGLVGGLGAAGLGFAGSEGLRHADLVLCAIPPVAVYVDLLCRHLSLRILVVGTFMRTQRDDPAGATLAAYEDFARRSRDLPGEKARSAFDLEDWALSWSTMAVSAAIAGYGIVLWSRFSAAFVISGLVGPVATALARRLFRDRFRSVVELA